MKKSASLRTRLSIIFGLTVLCLILILSLVIGQRSVVQVQNEIGGALGETAQSLGDTVDRYMWARYGEVMVLSELKSLKEPEDLGEVRALIHQLKLNFPSFSWIGFTDKNGKVLESSDDILKGVDISERPVFMNAKDGPFIGDVHDAVLLAKLLPNPSGEAMKFVDISIPIHNNKGEFIGVLATHLSWEWVKELRDTVKATIQNRENLEFFIVSDKSNDIILGPKNMLGKKLEVKSTKLAQHGDINGWTVEKWPDGKEYLTGYVKTTGYKQYDGLGWTILARQPADVAYAPAKELRMYMIFWGIALSILGAGVGWLIASKVVQPIQKLTAVADQLRLGRKVHVPHYKGVGEIEILSDSLRRLVTDLSTTETALEQMEKIAQHDTLTGLPNRKAYEYYLEKASDQYETLTILFMDLDGFKGINDKYGHHAGDQLLIETAARLKENIRAGELVSRLGGDEFVIVLTADKEPVKNGKKVGERMIQAINEPYFIDGELMHVGASIGGAVWNAGAGLIEEVVKLADGVLYEVKREGKNKVKFNNLAE
ncbi:diguanylate cyclase [Aciduricibacillus chroicocephali]|uniref:Diguanylate cyclase n=1 Tax=Aciduricibacillus chroicocephali TaxID=3054939 RepID=A0ABY9KX06_9BACI|nr:diguanylate cyclase [Bacillaceae bacterium 44XB]